jgi:hypothetical protein
MPARAAPKQQTKTRQAIVIALTRHPLNVCCHALVLPSFDFHLAVRGDPHELPQSEPGLAL